MIQTLWLDPKWDFCLPIGAVTRDVQLLALSVIQYCGGFGNMIFLLCSIFFLTESQNVKKRKLIQMIVDVWIISVLIFIIFRVTSNIEIEDKLVIVKQFFPITFANNWFITCYIILYAIHPALNSIINNLDKKILSWVLCFLAILYLGISFLNKDKFFFSSVIVVWCVVYLIFGYVKKYHSDVLTNTKVNIAFVITGLVGNIILVVLTNYLGLQTSLFSYGDSLLRWDVPSNPFLLVSSFGLVNLASSLKFTNRWINSLAGLSLLVYVIHENEIIRTYIRPEVWNYVYREFGFHDLFLWVLILTSAILIVSIGTSYLYKYTIQRFTNRITKAIVNR